MIQITKVLKRRESGMFFSFIIGLGITILLFHRPIGKQLQLSVPLSEIEGKTVKVDGQCFQYHAEDVRCEKYDVK
jgi:hypothetical protein